MMQNRRRTWLGPVIAIGVTVMLVAACSDGQVETTAPTSSAPVGETSTSTVPPPSTTSTAPPSTPATTIAPAGPAAAVDVAAGTPGWFLGASDAGLTLLRPDGVAVVLVDRAVSNAVAFDGTTIYFQYSGEPGISLLDLRTGRVAPAMGASLEEPLVLHGLAVGNRGPLPDERWLYYERITANGDHRLIRWQPRTGMIADLGVIAVSGDRVGRISYSRSTRFVTIVEHAGRRDFKSFGWDGEPLDVTATCATGCAPWPCTIATMGCEHLALGQGALVWVETVSGRQELVFGQTSPFGGEAHREGLPDGTVVDELLVRDSQVIVNTRRGDRAGPALVFDAMNKGGFVSTTAARLSWADDEQLTPLPVAAGGAYVFRSGVELWMAAASGGVQRLDEGPVGTFRAGPDHSVFFERIVDRAAGKRQEIWRVDVNTGTKALVLPVPDDQFDSIRLVVIAQVEGRYRLGYSRFERPPGATGEFDGRWVMYLTSLDGADEPMRVTAVGGNEWGVDVAAYANGWFVGTRGDIMEQSPAAFGVHGEPPSEALMAALRCQQVCDSVHGSSCAYANVVGCGFGFTISPDGKRLAWIESSHGAGRALFPSIVGHDLVIVDAETGAELQRSFVPAPTQGATDATVSWLGSDRLLVSIRRSINSRPAGPVTATYIAQLTERGAAFSRVVLADADDTAPVGV